MADDIAAVLSERGFLDDDPPRLLVHVFLGIGIVDSLEAAGADGQIVVVRASMDGLFGGPPLLQSLSAFPYVPATF